MRLRHIAICVLATTTFISFLLTETSLAQKRPAAPFVEKGVCPFECCRFGLWHARSPLTVYRREGDTSIVAFTIAVNDSFFAIAGNVRMDRPGTVIVTKPVDAFSPGDTIYTLSYRGEGFTDVWKDGSISEIEIFWGSDDEVDVTTVNPHDQRWEKFSGVLLAKPIMVWWVQVQNDRGQKGWLRLRNTTISGFSIDEQIDGMDDCG